MKSCTSIFVYSPFNFEKIICVHRMQYIYFHLLLQLKRLNPTELYCLLFLTSSLELTAGAGVLQTQVIIFIQIIIISY